MFLKALTQTHDEPPHDDHTVNVDSGTSTGNGLSEGTDDDDDQLETVHSLSTDDIGEPTKEKLSAKGTNGVRDLDTEILVVRVLAAVTVDVANHGGSHGDGKDVILDVVSARVSEEFECDSQHR